MQKLTKVVSRQDANFKLSPSSSNETSINLSKEISALISDENGDVTFNIYKNDFIKAMGALCLIPKLYFKKEDTPSSVNFIFKSLSAQIEAQFGQSETSLYTVSHLKRSDGRFYLNDLKKPNGFNLRAFLVEQFSFLTFTKDDNNELFLNIEATTPQEELSEELTQVIEDASKNIQSEQPPQIIYYGAPGTGKSHKIKKEIIGKPHFRTTFHPDTDYASFVGSYKPITKQVTRYDIYSKPIKDENGQIEKEDRIIYRYVFQAFLKAYIKAWEEMAKENPNNVFLIIEEINRGNCAQIFGDIFQLLDRNDKGFSDYPIVADDDLKQELSQVLGSLDIKNADFINSLYPGQGDIVAQIKSGDILLLPNNLLIRATMNTSDQSLFPIDSAFKRRWDWRYVNIKNHEEENYVISFSNGNKYSWWDFLTEINSRIEGGDIQQEDKKLGYFFAKTKNGEISAETFLSKVIFFLYNDVFKDFGLDFDFFKDEDDNTMSFASYFDHRGKIIENRVEKFLNNLGINPLIFSEEEEMKQDKLESSHDESKDLRSRKLTIRFKDGEIIQENTRFESFRKALEKIGLDKAEQITSEKEYVRLNSPFVTKESTPEIEEAPDYSYVQSGEYYILKGANTRTLRNVLNTISDRLDLGLTITVE